jgi:mRNA interferase RelE/StbE
MSRHGEFWRYRVDDYGILCRLEDEKLEVLVVRLGHRRDIYD